MHCHEHMADGTVCAGVPAHVDADRGYPVCIRHIEGGPVRAASPLSASTSGEAVSKEQGGRPNGSTVPMTATSASPMAPAPHVREYPCPDCGQPMAPVRATNSRNRHDLVWICSRAVGEYWLEAGRPTWPEESPHHYYGERYGRVRYWRERAGELVDITEAAPVLEAPNNTGQQEQEAAS